MYIPTCAAIFLHTASPVDENHTMIRGRKSRTGIHGSFPSTRGATLHEHENTSTVVDETNAKTRFTSKPVWRCFLWRYRAAPAVSVAAEGLLVRPNDSHPVVHRAVDVGQCKIKSRPPCCSCEARLLGWHPRSHTTFSEPTRKQGVTISERKQETTA